jgi:hypothetical protein
MALVFTEAGRLIWWHQDGHRGMILARTRTVAQQYVEWVARDLGRNKVSIVETGTEPGETLMDLLIESYEDGADHAYVLKTVPNDDGPVTAGAFEFPLLDEADAA